MQARRLLPAIVSAWLLGVPGSAAAAWQVLPPPSTTAQPWYSFERTHVSTASPAPPTPPSPPATATPTASRTGNTVDLADGWFTSRPASRSGGTTAASTPGTSPAGSQSASQTQPGATGTSGSGASGGVTLSAAEQELLDATNQARLRHGLNALTINPILEKLAREKSQDMITHNYFGHDSPDLGSPLQMQRAAGLQCRIMGAENIAGARDIGTAIMMFMTSPGHLANILYPGLTVTGVGVVQDGPYGVYVTQEFAGGC